MLERFQLFTVLVAKASRYIRKLKTEEMGDFNLKSAHVSCIYYLYTIGEMTATELCEVCYEDKSNISRSVDYLQVNGYIAFSDVQKRYKTPLRLTEKGKDVGKKLHDKITGILLSASEGISREEREIFYKSFEIINANLEKMCKRYEE